MTVNLLFFDRFASSLNWDVWASKFPKWPRLLRPQNWARCEFRIKKRINAQRTQPLHSANNSVEQTKEISPKTRSRAKKQNVVRENVSRIEITFENPKIEINNEHTLLAKYRNEKKKKRRTQSTAVVSLLRIHRQCSWRNFCWFSFAKHISLRCLLSF